MATRNNFGGLTSGTTFEGVDMVVLTVDYINNMVQETEDPQDPNSTKAGLKIFQDTVASFVNVLSVGPLHDANTQQSFLVRKDSLSQSTVTALQAALRALPTDQITSDGGVASMDVTVGEIAFKDDEMTSDSDGLDP
tara:strand:- start:186 stop:596 length:411 start_codon:yes stop_codon:yes gene_type:complete